MKWIMWFLRGVLFLFLFGFAVKNDQLVTLHFFFGAEWRLPVVFVMVIFFAAGAVLGVTATLASLLKQRREIGRLRRASRAPATSQQTAPVPDGDAPEAF
ncbi:MAG: LapA family protein [Zoogloeaceae bacterium]|nr:LapA family protein [Zoogloeaceae bacterium]